MAMFWRMAGLSTASPIEENSTDEVPVYQVLNVELQFYFVQHCGIFR
ncbi:hypothetical protein H5410_007235 [Solanum commersonii]|uniref:Uncharacterized protein n=1 Tax=Solanum commersonii TaxID=4109 RepID=A0A9J6AC21_SOLCO|nr:hypothetical protein H5410_007235 [Solanum commersonii]